MKKSLSFCLVLMTALLLTGCSDKFEPTESTIYITSKGVVKSAIMESFDKAYYDFDELSDDVTKAVEAYCLDLNSEAIAVESLTEENDVVTLLMEYQTVKHYAQFNSVLLFSGTLSEAEAAGYMPEEIYDADGQLVELNLEEQGDLKVVVTEESICVQTSGTIKYVSDNVTIVDRKLAKAMEAGKEHPAFIIYK